MCRPPFYGDTAKPFYGLERKRCALAACHRRDGELVRISGCEYS